MDDDYSRLDGFLTPRDLLAWYINGIDKAQLIQRAADNAEADPWRDFICRNNVTVDARADFDSNAR